jgi:hypothetical protein
VGWKRRAPDRLAGTRSVHRPGVRDHLPLRIDPDEVAPAEDVQRARPDVRVDLRLLPGRRSASSTRTCSFSRSTSWWAGSR